MSDPVYRIEVSHDPNETAPWFARAYRVSDDTYMSGSVQVAYSAEEAMQKVRDWIAVDREKQEGFSVFTDEAGNILADLHSVKS